MTLPFDGVSLEAALDWLPGRTQRLRDLVLPFPNTAGAAAIHSLCVDLAARADEAREQRPAERSASIELCAQLVAAIADRVRDPAIAAALRHQAAALASPEMRKEAACQAASLNTSDFWLWCGTLATWDTKSRGLGLSVLLFERSPELCSYIAAVDDRLTDAIARLPQLVGERLSLTTVAPFIVGSLLVCGGEANTAPKHFSYFLPEDFGVTRTPTPRMTVVFSNIYLARYTQIAAVAARELLGQSDVLTDDNAALRMLLLWFRGHDIAHSFRSSATNFRALKAVVGAENSVVLQEALVDAMGLLLALEVTTQNGLGMTQSQVVRVFLAELIGYLRRGARWFPDSGAAAIELAFLVEHGAVRVDASGRLDWDFIEMRRGVAELSRFLVRAVLQGDAALAKDGLERYLERPAAEVRAFVDGLPSRLEGVPTSFSYRVPAPRERADPAEVSGSTIAASA